MRRRHPVTRALAALAVLLVLGGCAFRSGTAESATNWKIKVDQALGAATSSLGTAALVLENQQDGHLTRAYVVVTLRDALKTLGSEAAAFASVQPPHTRAKQNRDAVRALGNAVTVLNDASTAATDGDGGERRRALHDVRQSYSDIQELNDKLTGAG